MTIPNVAAVGLIQGKGLPGCLNRPSAHSPTSASAALTNTTRKDTPYTPVRSAIWIAGSHLYCE